MLPLFVILFSSKLMQFLMIVQVQDVSSFSYGLASDEGPISVGSNGVIFPKGQLIPSTAVLRLQRTSFFQLEAFYPNQYELPPGTFPKISSFMVCSL